MNTSVEFVRLGSRIRRYARAVAGSPAIGDDLMAATLELISKSKGPTAPAQARLEIFRALLDLWNGVFREDQRNPASQPIEPNEPWNNAQADLPLQVFLLEALEGMTPAEISAVIGRDHQAVGKLLRHARDMVSRIRGANVLIIEDELFVATDLESIVEELGHTVADLVATETEAVSRAAELRPDLILSDIQLADGSSGLDAVARIQAVADIPAVIITAFPERLLTGAAKEPAYLIQKPFRSEDVRANINSAIFLSRTQQPETAPKSSAITEHRKVASSQIK